MSGASLGAGEVDSVERLKAECSTGDRLGLAADPADFPVDSSPRCDGEDRVDLLCAEDPCASFRADRFDDESPGALGALNDGESIGALAADALALALALCVAPRAFGAGLLSWVEPNVVWRDR